MQLIRHADRKRFRFGVLTFDFGHDGYLPELEKLEVKVWQIPSRRRGLRIYRKALDDFFRQNGCDFDIVHFHAGSLTTLAPLEAARRNGVKHRILHMHASGCSGLHNKILHRLNRRRLRDLASIRIACSNGAAEWGFRGCDDCHIVRNGIDVGKFLFSVSTRENVRDALGLSPSIHALVHVGTFNRIKNQAFLIPVLVELRKKHSEAVLFLIGDGVFQERVRELAENMGVAEAVRFLGRRNDVNELLQGMDVLLLPSLSEGYPYVVLEAFTASLPVVVADTFDAERELPVSARLPLDCPEVWAKNVAELCEKSRTTLTPQESMRFSVGNTVRHIEEIYSGIIGNKGL